jgi:hypothetical protein
MTKIRLLGPPRPFISALTQVGKKLKTIELDDLKNKTFLGLFIQNLKRKKNL